MIRTEWEEGSAGPGKLNSLGRVFCDQSRTIFEKGVFFQGGWAVIGVTQV